MRAVEKTQHTMLQHIGAIKNTKNQKRRDKKQEARDKRNKVLAREDAKREHGRQGIALRFFFFTHGDVLQ